MGEFYGNQHVDPDRDSYEELVEKIEALAAERDEPPTTADAASDDRFPSIATIYRILEDDWLQALRDAGVQPTAEQIASYDEADKQRMIEDLSRAAATTDGETLTSHG